MVYLYLLEILRLFHLVYKSKNIFVMKNGSFKLHLLSSKAITWEIRIVSIIENYSIVLVEFKFILYKIRGSEKCQSWVTDVHELGRSLSVLAPYVFFIKLDVDETYRKYKIIRDGK